MKISVVIPAHNEAAHIARTVHGALKNVKSTDEVIVVADHCSDDTEKIVEDAGQHDSRVRLLRNTERRGSFSNALIIGFAAATGDAVVPLMGDGCDDPSTIDRMAQAMDERQADIVCGSRYMRGGGKIGGPLLQNVLSRIVSALLRLVGAGTSDAPNAFKMYRSSMLEKIDYVIPDTGTEYSLGLLLRCKKAGARMVDVPTTWTWKEAPLPFKDEWKILRRFRGYMRWIRRFFG